MAIIDLPPKLHNVQQLVCAICHVKLLLSKATAGLFDASNHQAFACISHFLEVELLIVGWADFTARERRRYEQQKQKASTLIYERWDNAWLDS